MAHRHRITIFDTTLRDGEQSPGIALWPEEKAEIARSIVRPGVDVIQAGFAVFSVAGRVDEVEFSCEDVSPGGRDDGRWTGPMVGRRPARAPASAAEVPR